MKVIKVFRFEAAHRLPYVDPTHKCHNLHGHSYRVEVEVSGGLDFDKGWVVDFGEISERWDGRCKPLLDHQVLNDHLDNPTAEELALFIMNKLAGPWPITKITVWETERSAAVLETTPTTRKKPDLSARDLRPTPDHQVGA